MRDYALTLFIIGTLPFILKKPYIGILVWSWISYMNPHRLTWGFAYDMPFAQIVAIFFIISLFLHKEKRGIPINALTIMWGLFILWMMVTTLFAIYPEQAFDQLIKIMKIQLVVCLTILVIDTKEKINYLIWVIVLSIGYYSVKGGLFTITSGGGSRVYGPPGGFIQENNSLALATLMIIPLMYYLARLHKDNRLIYWGLIGAIVMSSISVFGSQSRGALLGAGAVGLFFWLKSRNKLISGTAMVVFGILLFNLMPQSWYERMATIENYEEDSSAMGRINAWRYAINVADDRLTGGGLESWSPSTFMIYAPDPDDWHAAHSIYFSILGDHGWIGLVFYLLIIWLTWRSLKGVLKKTRDIPELEWMSNLVKMIQVSFIAYATGGAFLSLAYFDLPWHLLSIVLICSEMLRRWIGENSVTAEKRKRPMQSIYN